MRLAALLLGLPLLATPPRFTAQDAVQAEWRRQPLALPVDAAAQLPPADRARLALAQKRIGAPGAMPLLPPELEKPTEEAWLKRAAVSRTPQDRFTALFFLNRLKSPRALSALEGLGAGDARAWPKHLHLEAGIAAARINGADVGAHLQAFLDALRKVGKVDPVRAQAARLRMVMAGKEKDLLPPVKATPGAILALMDAWNRAPWEQRRDLALTAFKELDSGSPAWRALGLQAPSTQVLGASCTGVLARLAEGTPDPGPEDILQVGGSPWPCAQDPLALWYASQALPKFRTLPAGQAQGLNQLVSALEDRPMLLGAFLPALRKHDPGRADTVRAQLLQGSDPVARAAALDDLAEAPSDLDALIQRLWKVEEYDGVQILLQSLEKWKLGVDRRTEILKRFAEHPCWTARLDAFTQLRKLDPAAPWPDAPAPTSEDEAQLKLAEELAAKAQPVRMRITFEGKRAVVLRLDPRNAPLNVANLVRLARRGFFDGRRVPRVVPDFVVQMGSPCDTMDGGPGYAVRCENSLTWYGPGSVGMALSGKDTGGSQFFITTNATPHLTGRYTRVGEVEDPDRALPMLDALELGAKILKVEVLGK